MSSLSCRRAAGRGLRLLLIVQMVCTGYGVLSLTNHQLNPVQQCTASTSDVGCDTRPLVALVLARSGSKAVPLKNLRTVGGLSLLAHSLLAIRRSGVFGEVWVSTDHVAIAQEAEQYGAQVHYRPAAVAQDNTTSIASVQEFLVRHPLVQNVALVQCTSVFLRAEYLRIAQRLFDEAVDRPGVTVDCVFAVVRSFKLRWQWLHDQQKLVAVNFDPVRRPRRQDWFGELVETGMFYVATRQLLESGRFQNERCRFVEVVAEDALEIDTLDDLNMANILYENRMKTHPATSD